jgi:uncharacterized protein YqeY
MLREKLNELIKNAMLSHDNTRLEVIRSIKTAFTNFEKEGKELTDADESKILLKMVSQREDSIEQYNKGVRYDLAEKEQNELNILKEYVPKQPTDEEITNLTKGVIAAFETQNGRKVEMRDMKTILTEVQKTYPSANGKIVSGVVKSCM